MLPWLFYQSGQVIVTSMGEQRFGFGPVSRFMGYSLVLTTNNYCTITDFHIFQSTVAHALEFSVSRSNGSQDGN
jgi:hypothetical protein